MSHSHLDTGNELIVRFVFDSHIGILRQFLVQPDEKMIKGKYWPMFLLSVVDVAVSLHPETRARQISIPYLLR